MFFMFWIWVITMLTPWCQENKLVRLAAYNQLQALAHQLSLLTRGAFDLDSFKLPDDLVATPVKPGQKRFRKIDPETGAVRAGVQMLENGAPSEVFLLPERINWWKNVPLLVLQLDQGAIGAAGASCPGWVYDSQSQVVLKNRSKWWYWQMLLPPFFAVGWGLET